VGLSISIGTLIIANPKDFIFSKDHSQVHQISTKRAWEKLGDDWVELQLEDAEAMRKEYEESMDRNWRNFIGAAAAPKKEGVPVRKRKAIVEEEEEG